MNYPQLATIKTCTGCLACLDSCTQKAVSDYIGNDGHIYIKCDATICIGCHKCEAVCPVVNGLSYSSNDLKSSYAYAAFCTEDELYENSTSGGVFAALAKEFILNGGYVCGVILEDNKAKHIISNNLTDIKRMQGSKYMQSCTNGIYRKIEALLKDGHKVLFCGMGCQAAALCSYFKKNKNRDNLFVIDMICGGVTSSIFVKKFIQNEKDYTSVVGFRKKNEYVLSCTCVDGNIEFLHGQRPLPLMGFFSGTTKRYSCGDCRFTGVERLSDITIGDYWGSDNNVHQSVAIVHTTKGEWLLGSLKKLKKEKIDWSFLSHNFRCIIGKNYNNNRFGRKHLGWILNNCSYKSLLGLYGCTFNNPIFLCVFIYNVIVTKIQLLIINRQKDKIIHKLQQQ